MNEVLNIIKERRSIRKFNDKIIEKEKLEKIMEATLAAPTARNDQNMFYVLLSDRNKIDKILKSLDLEKNYFSCTAILFSFKRCDDYLNDLTTGAALENALLEIEELKLSACWVHSSVKTLDTLKGREILKDVLELDDLYHPSDTLAIGYFDDIKPDKKERKYNYDKII